MIMPARRWPWQTWPWQTGSHHWSIQTCTRVDINRLHFPEHSTKQQFCHSIRIFFSVLRLVLCFSLVWPSHYLNCKGRSSHRHMKHQFGKWIADCGGAASPWFILTRRCENYPPRHCVYFWAPSAAVKEIAKAPFMFLLVLTNHSVSLRSLLP